MRKTTAIILLIAAFILCGQLFAQVITAKELAGIMDDENVVIVSGRSEKDYNTVHIKGAVHVLPDDLCKPGDIKGILKSPDDIATIFGDKGISNTNTIVVYCNKGVAAGRLFWIFDYLGCENIKFLDGQMKAWRKARKPVTKSATEIVPATFEATPNPDLIATMAYVKSHLDDDGVILVDTRSVEEFNGEKGEASRKGHIPGAVHFEYKNVVDDDGYIKPKADIEKALKAAGITSDKEIILYCETSARAGVVYMVLKYILGYPNVKVYDGGIYEWAATASNPME
ncbi:hypothetical protein DRQ36_06700 [bacterium]|nr:MAG: hypothetical protein DRQ36_06700 [bacterium]